MAAVIKPPFIYEHIVVTHKGDKYTFTASGRKIIQSGWKSTQASGEGDEEEDEALGKVGGEAQEIPDVKPGDSILLRDPQITSHERKPPKSFSEAAVLAAMKRYELGTPATRDSIIEGLVNNEYCFRKGKNFLPSEKAFFFIDAIASIGNDGLSKYLIVTNTQDWENFLEKNSKGFFDTIKEFVISTIGALKDKKIVSFQSNIGICPACGGVIVSGKYSYYCEEQKEKKCTFSISKSICDAVISEVDVKSLLSGKKTGIKNMKSKNGNKFKAFLKLGPERKVLFEFPESKEKKK
jgi:DNA topoisomerase-3